jgi:soluble lytic murein transglycosylase-like protein
MDKLVVAKQAVLNLAGARLSLDGIAGPATARATANAPAEVKTIFDQLSDLQANVARPRRVPELEVQDVIVAVALENNVPAAFALRVADLESRFDPSAISHTGQHFGLFQVGERAVADVTERYGLEPAPRGDFLDVRWNAKAGILYLKLVAAWIGRDVAVSADWPHIYAAYNIGVGNYRKLVDGSLKDQSLALAVASQSPELSRNGVEGYLPAVETVFTV